MAEQPPAPNEPPTDLVAYLDGELDEKTKRAVEAQLRADPRARAEVDSLGRVWELLDYLPQPQPSPNFTHRTLERVSVLRPTAPALRRRRAWLLGAGWAAVLLLAAGAGFAGTYWLVPRDRTDEALARDLRVIENRRLYEPVGDIDYLWELERPDLFGDEPAS